MSTSINTTKKTGRKKKPYQSFISGSTAGVVELLIMYPTELVKTQMQLFPTKYTGPFQCATSIVKENGYKALYKGGLKPLLAGTVIKSKKPLKIFLNFNF